MEESPIRDVKTHIIFEKAELKKKSYLFLFVKRLIDICGALIGVLLVGVSFVVIGMLYLFGENRGPIFFKQERIGKNGQIFNIYKYRSMVLNAEEKLKADKQLYAKYIANNYKLEQAEDPRITRIGASLRKTSIDELPQFINVLKGEMSLVGPRPIVVEELVEYGQRINEFVSVKPGITGHWAVSGRSNVEYPERVELELEYINNQSLFLDLKIIIMTITTVFLKKGAY